MEKNELQSFTARITQANRSQLVVITYDIILCDLNDAKKAYKENNNEIYDKSLKHSQKFINELISTLDFKYPISLDLIQLYLYSSKRIIMALIKKDPEYLESAIKVMENLKKGFEGICEKDYSETIMENTQQLYAGLTYGKGQLNETYIDPLESSRGYKA